MSSSGLSSPRLQLPEEEIHHEASTSKQKEDDVVMEIKDDQSDNEEIDAWANSILHANRNIEGEQEPFATIPRVPERLRQGDYDAFEPNIISIGPYRWGQPRFQPMEKHKWLSVEAILMRNARYSLADYIREIKEMEITARSRYSGNIYLESREFVEMLLFDGCFVVEYLLKEGLPNLMDDGIPDTRTWMDDAIRNDLLLLENQLPFFIVQLIYEMVTGEEPLQLMRLTHNFFKRVSPINMSGLTFDKPPVHYWLVHHLLHLYHWFLFSTKNEGKRLGPTNQGSSSKKLKWTIPSATFLEEAGIKFREKTEVTASLMDATFENGVMKITPLFIDAFTVSQFRNLIALEKFDPYIEPQVLAFSQFMDYIINTSKDVALLRKKGIIEHAFGSNEEVATFFNQLTSGTLEYRTPEMTRMYKDVDDYCKTKRHRWREILMRDYFGSPWTAISLVAAVILLSLTFIQTFFSMYAYFKPPSAT
ncbi:hypothetical protein AAC387_Pa03g1040 [Persea americana]